MVVEHLSQGRLASAHRLDCQGRLLEVAGLLTACHPRAEGRRHTPRSCWAVDRLPAECSNSSDCLHAGNAAMSNTPSRHKCDGHWVKALTHLRHLGDCAALRGEQLDQNGGRAFHCVTMLREPVERAVSGWFYRGHHPDVDAYRVWSCKHGDPCRCAKLAGRDASERHIGGTA